MLPKLHLIPERSGILSVELRGSRLFDDYSTVGVMKQWRVCLVSQSISTEKRQRLLTATEAIQTGVDAHAEC